MVFKDIGCKGIREEDFTGGVVPTSDDIECFNLWLKKWRKNRLFVLVYSLVLIILIACIAIFSGSLRNINQILLFVGIYLIFLWSLYIVFLDYKRSSKWQICKCGYATVIKKHRGTKHNPKRVVVSVDEKSFTIRNGIVDFRKFKVGSIVLIFTVGDGNVYIAVK